MLKIKDLEKNFGGVQALTGVSFAAQENELIGLIGPNGAGKSTLVNVITGSFKPSKGQIWFDEERVDGLFSHELAKRGIGRTFQITRAFRRMIVMENMLVPALTTQGNISIRSLRKKAMEVLEFLTIDHLADEFARSLSGGQQKLLELGRLLMLNPKLLILDEPFAGVHPKLRETIHHFILEVNKDGKAFIIISHDMRSMFALSRRLIVLNWGQIIADGPPETVKNDPAVIEAYLGKEEDDGGPERDQ